MHSMLQAVDRMRAKVTWIENARGWKCFVSGVSLPPHMGIGRTPMLALEEVLRFAKAFGWRT